MSLARNSARACRPVSGRVPRLEQLEDRTLPSATLGGDLLGLPASPASYSTDHILVRFLDGSQDWSSFSLVEGTRISQKLDLVDGLYHVELDGTVTVEEALAAYGADPRVADVSPDYTMTVDAATSDPGLSTQWGLHNDGTNGTKADADIDAPEAWAVATGNYGVTVAVMDTGIDFRHEDLYQNIWINQGEIPTTRLAGLADVDGDGLITFLDLNDSRNQGQGKIQDFNNNGVIDGDDLLTPMVKDAAGKDTGKGGWADGVSQDGDKYVDDLIGWNFVSNTNRPYDDNGHGTHVAGIIGAMGDNGTGVAGVVWQVQLMPVKWMGGDGKGSIGSFVAGLNYAVAKGAKISNNSWSGTSYSDYLLGAIQKAQQAGHIFVAASGNNGRNTDTSPSYPSSFPLDNIVSVAGIDSGDKLAGYSNYGVESVDLAAPGSGIYSTRPNNSYRSSSGTSMATPFVTGVIALVWSEHPGWSYQQVLQQVYATTEATSALQGKTATGGRVNAAGALGADTSPQDTVAPYVVAASASGPSADSFNSVRVTFSESIDPATFGTSAVTLLGPTGAKVGIVSVKAVSGSNNTQFDVTFLTQTAEGAYSFKIATSVRDLAGNPLAGYQTVFQITSTFTYTSTKSTAIVDGKDVVSSIVINDSWTIEDIQVSVDIDHTYDGDLFIYLEAPDGTEVILSYRRGRSGDDFQGTRFSDGAATAVYNGTAPFAGTYRPDRELSALDGGSAQGTWKLHVHDQARGDQGVLNGWSITIKASTGALTGGEAAGTVASISDGEPIGPAATGELPFSSPDEQVQVGVVAAHPGNEGGTWETSAFIEAYQISIPAWQGFSPADPGLQLDGSAAGKELAQAMQGMAPLLPGGQAPVGGGVPAGGHTHPTASQAMDEAVWGRPPANPGQVRRLALWLPQEDADAPAPEEEAEGAEAGDGGEPAPETEGESGEAAEEASGEAEEASGEE